MTAPALRAFVAELVAAGIREAVVCPGSRSGPLALAIAAHSAIRLWVLVDERSAGFFALGIARTAGRPVVLAATSGTAVVEFAPAVVEAAHGRVPLVVLTADRPAELRDRGAPQTIDQTRLYGTAARWFAELPLDDGTAGTLAHWRSVAGRAVAIAGGGPAGPIQVNIPFREPLVPDGPLVPDAWSVPGPGGAPGAGPGGAQAPGPALFAAVIAGARTLGASQAGSLAARLRAQPHGLIIAGPITSPELPDAVARLAGATGYPIIADPLSGLRAGPHDRSLVIARGDQLARPGPWIDAHRPRLVVRFGAMPTSRPLVELLARAAPELQIIDGDAGWRESALIGATFIHADEVLTADALTAAVTESGAPGRGPWTDAWLDADAAVDMALTAWLATLTEPFEAEPFVVAPDALPDGTTLWAGSSMPVRDLDGWLPSTARAIRVCANRGANGIDGVVSTALGSAAVADGPVVLVVGDLSFLHDLGGLVAARLHDLRLVIVLVNNDGGGIFSFLPPATTVRPEVGLPERYEQLFGTPHGIDPGPIVRAFGFRHRRVEAGELREVLTAALPERGLTVLELRTDRARNVALHHEAAAGAARVLAARVPGR